MIVLRPIVCGCMKRCGKYSCEILDAPSDNKRADRGGKKKESISGNATPDMICVHFFLACIVQTKRWIVETRKTSEKLVSGIPDDDTERYPPGKKEPKQLNGQRHSKRCVGVFRPDFSAC